MLSTSLRKWGPGIFLEGLFIYLFLHESDFAMKCVREQKTSAMAFKHFFCLTLYIPPVESWFARNGGVAGLLAKTWETSEPERIAGLSQGGVLPPHCSGQALVSWWALPRSWLKWPVSILSSSCIPCSSTLYFVELFCWCSPHTLQNALVWRQQKTRCLIIGEVFAA